MATQMGAVEPDGEAETSPATRPTAEFPEIELLFRGPCNCLPDPQGDWLACAYCGLKQSPGKEFCGYCGHRWVTDPEG